MKFGFASSLLLLAFQATATSANQHNVPAKPTAFLPKSLTGGAVAAATKKDSTILETHMSQDLNQIVDKDLKDDIEMLSAMLASVVKKENPKVYDLYTQLRKHGVDRAAGMSKRQFYFHKVSMFANLFFY